ncbi:hypothetical protein SPRG_05554 [Saprolegnia parasitica CBS 223.65]|uniref:SAP domain-containing protein n=1 Tax=Saprolegnia parasitica (strain CBS 223.65) TaxID=695850 RepID=A0A067CSV1_SAPPC|nr:hypothetical protein SPRG_05554 [Saprolegnia parasitica CBS 223.65]KDO29601.1 hypothetical protein SPRG_05554 [Saprolegnia parasitica CBS 223.65]|eukprot:XP_012199661.1 hypothetical protein SPRG_05554 [Saprolegnia parasitica CBS 223.65]
MPSTDAIDRMTVKKLQAELQKHGAATRGTKAELKARLVALLEESNAPAASEEAPASDCNTDAPADDVPSPTTEAPLPANEAPSAASEPSKPLEPTATVEPEATATSHENADDHAHATTTSDEPMATEPDAIPATTTDVAASSVAPDETAAPPAKKRKVDETAAVVPPAKNPVSCTLRIDNFVQLSTYRAIIVHLALVQADGVFVEDQGFWIDSIKTHCYVTFATPEIATATRQRLHGVVWPAHHGKALSVDYAVSTAKAIATANPVPELRRRPTLVASVGKPTAASLPAPPVTMDDLFWKTTTKPVLYYLPLTSEQVALRQTSAVATTTTTSL